MNFTVGIVTTWTVVKQPKTGYRALAKNDPQTQ